jgi:uncharacterized membrane protein
MEQEKQLDMLKPKTDEKSIEQKRVNMILTIISKALDVLGLRLILLLSLVLSACLFGWVMIDPTVVRLLGAIFFTCLTFIPSLLRRGNADA